MSRSLRVEPFLKHLRSMLEQERQPLAEIERRAGLSPPALSDLLEGRRELTVSQTLALLEVTEIDPQEFFHLIGMVYRRPPEPMSEAEERAMIAELMPKLDEMYRQWDEIKAEEEGREREPGGPSSDPED